MNALIKRAFDLIVVVLALPLWVPLLGLTALLVRWRLGSPVFFRQRRPGLNGRLFELIKFRSMLNSIASDGRLLPDEDRLTSFGKKLRASSLDELPELINVLRGEMSLVGPRPLLVQYLERYTPRQARRHDLKPGITGLAQVSGRNALSWAEKFELDVKYVENQSIYLDIQILFMTFGAVFGRRGITAQGDATMPEFKPGLAQSIADEEQ